MQAAEMAASSRRSLPSRKAKSGKAGKVKSLIIYAKWGEAEKDSKRKLHFVVDDMPLNVRIEVCGGDYCVALNKARPRHGETVLNTLPIPENRHS